MNNDLLLSDRGFLCGYFSISTPQTLYSYLANWERLFVPNSKEHELEAYQNFYYPGILNLQFRERQTYRLTVNQQVAIALSEDKKVNVQVLDVRVHIYPYGVLIYSIHVQVDQTNVADTLHVFSLLRNLQTLGKDMCRDFYNVSFCYIQQLYDLCSNRPKAKTGLSHLVENGNKLKLFHIAHYNSVLTEQEKDNLLFSAGTLYYNDINSESASNPSYIQQELSEHKVSVFNNWTALALLDTFSIITGGALPSWLIQNWEDDYFEILYLYQLYYKVYLYRLGLQYRLQERSVEVLQQELDDFDRCFTYPSVSYNFLPNMLNKAMAKGLNVTEEKEQVAHIISLAAASRQEERQKKSNRFLTFLTIMASFSAIWDICSLTDAIFGFSDTFSNAIYGYRLTGSLLLLMVCVVALLNHKRK